MLGFKDLTTENYLEVDEVMQAWVALDSQGAIQPIHPDKWAEEILGVCLADSVPVEVQRLFQVARGAMLYGFFFYPLYALSSEQLLRTADTAVSMRCRQLNAPGSVKRFEERIDWLGEQGILSDDEAGRWHALRGLRNSASHPADQTILAPGMALDLMQRIAEDVSRLFAR